MVKIFYIEDNEDNLYMLSNRLARRGYEVVSARNGEQGIAMAASEAPALILMDLAYRSSTAGKLRVASNRKRQRGTFP